MVDLETLKTLNERSLVFNKGLKSIYVTDIDVENALIRYKVVNDFYSDELMSVYDFIAKLLSMEISVLNIDDEIIGEFFECYDIENAPIQVNAEYREMIGVMTVRVYNTMICAFPIFQIVESNTDELLQRVIEGCRKLYIPLSEFDLASIKKEIQRCITEEIEKKKYIKCNDLALTKWVFTEHLFSSDN